MKPNKNGIGSETAKLLKDCGVESECCYTNLKSTGDPHIYSKMYQNNEYKIIDKNGKGWVLDAMVSNGGLIGTGTGEERGVRIYPAYTWQDIKDNAEVFFGKENIEIRNNKDKLVISDTVNSYHLYWVRLLVKQKKYKEADLYFRENCVLIRNYDIEEIPLLTPKNNDNSKLHNSCV